MVGFILFISIFFAPLWVLDFARYLMIQKPRDPHEPIAFSVAMFWLLLALFPVALLMDIA